MLTLEKELCEQIIRQCKREFPNEACGILAGPPSSATNLGGLRRVAKVYEMANADASPESFFMDAKEQLKVTKEIRNSGLEMLAIYHSHVASPAYPSAHDIELAFYPEASYIIISLKDKNNPQIRSFKIIEGKITEEELKIE